jgi:glycine/serine hydroxymethyltransferase
MGEVASLIARALRGREDSEKLATVRNEVRDLCRRFDPYPGGVASAG